MVYHANFAFSHTNMPPISLLAKRKIRPLNTVSAYDVIWSLQLISPSNVSNAERHDYDAPFPDTGGSISVDFRHLQPTTAKINMP